MKNNRYIYIIMASLLVLLVSLGATSATDITDNSTVQSDTPVPADTTAIDYTTNDILDNKDTTYETIDNSKLSTKRSTNENSVDITPNNYDNIDTYMTQYLH